MTIRRAKSADIPAVLDLLAEVNLIHHFARPDIFKCATKYSAVDLEKIFADDGTPVFVYDDGEKVLGYAFCEIKSKSRDTLFQDMKMLFIDDFCVDEAARGKGIGTALLDHVEAYAKEIGCTSISLNVWSFNDAARAFYEKHGMRPQRTIMEKKI